MKMSKVLTQTIMFYVFISNVIYANPIEINLINSGAIPDGITDNTQVIQKTIDRCSSNGGGTIYLPAGTFMSATIFLKDNITLKLNESAVLKAIPSGDAYPGKHFLECGFVRIDGAQNVSIVGRGTIDGSGDHSIFQKGNNGSTRPYLVHCRDSRNILIRDVQLKNSAFWTLRLFQNDGVRIDGISIYSHNNWNNDGIDVDSKNVTISNCRIDCDDDGICLKSDGTELCENVVITNCNIASNCNPIKFGTASKAGFRNIVISNCVIHTASESKFRNWNEVIQGVSDPITCISGIALEVVDGGLIDQVTITNISMLGVQTPIFIRLGSRSNATGSLQNVIISNITATTHSLLPCCISGVPGFNVENVIIRDMVVQCKGGGTLEDANRDVPEKEGSYPENRMFGDTLPAYGMYIRHAKNISLNNVQFHLLQPDYRPAIYLDDVEKAILRGFQATKPYDNHKIIKQNQSTVKVLD